jgi:hypothetical protein
LKWSGLHKVRETPDLFMFYYSKRIAYYLPKRVLPSEVEVEDLRDLIRRRLTPSVPIEGFCARRGLSRFSQISNAKYPPRHAAFPRRPASGLRATSG